MEEAQLEGLDLFRQAARRAEEVVGQARNKAFQGGNFAVRTPLMKIAARHALFLFCNSDEWSAITAMLAESGMTIPLWRTGPDAFGVVVAGHLTHNGFERVTTQNNELRKAMPMSFDEVVYFIECHGDSRMNRAADIVPFIRRRAREIAAALIEQPTTFASTIPEKV